MYPKSDLLPDSEPVRPYAWHVTCACLSFLSRLMLGSSLQRKFPPPAPTAVAVLTSLHPGVFYPRLAAQHQPCVVA
ncbi:hypothetical protein D9756_001216 [Leucocoprinus leucothites]|uniref:Uncharacterized protein n=1 Tax=Leucocoprinus leucothites TaxID=201217 RepID=A0A8H5LIG3_9AGAR|nr:hypothetical protein D9756_001216 [Leucoagaricus leucothites]